MLKQVQSRNGQKIETFSSTKLMEELRETNPNRYMIYFKRLIDLKKLHSKINQYLLNFENKEIQWQAKDRRFKSSQILKFNNNESRLIYRHDENHFTIDFTRGSCMIYPNNEIENSFQKSIKFVKLLEAGGYLQ